MINKNYNNDQSASDEQRMASIGAATSSAAKAAIARQKNSAGRLPQRGAETSRESEL